MLQLLPEPGLREAEPPGHHPGAEGRLPGPAGEQPPTAQQAGTRGWRPEPRDMEVARWSTQRSVGIHSGGKAESSVAIVMGGDRSPPGEAS